MPTFLLEKNPWERLPERFDFALEFGFFALEAAGLLALVALVFGFVFMEYSYFFGYVTVMLPL